jgi:hypothetical protein
LTVIRGRPTISEEAPRVIVEIHLHRQAKLVQVAAARRFLSCAFAASKGREEERGEDADNRDDDEKLDEGEGGSGQLPS